MPFGSASFEKEWVFLCDCASPVKKISSLNPQLDWNVVLNVAKEHGMLGVLTKRLQEINFAEVPEIAREKLQTYMRSQHLFTLSMTAELFRILGDFSESGIEAVLVKGPLTSLLAYNDPGVRSYVDLDVLVRQEEIRAATLRMIDLGFESDVPLSVIEAGKIPGEYLFRRAATAQVVELHTERTFRYYPRRMRLEELFGRQRRVPLDGQEIPALSLEDEFVLDAIHGAKHFWERLMWVADIAAIVARHPELDWQKARRAAEDVGGLRMLYLALRLADIVLKVPVPAAMKEEVKRNVTVMGLCAQVVRWLPYAGYEVPAWKERAIFRMRMRGGGLAGVGYLVRLSLSPTQEDWTEGAEGHRSWALDAVRRPMRLLKKYRSGD